MPETPREHSVEPEHPAITAEDLCYSYEIEGATCQINEQGNIIVDGQTSGIENDRYLGVIETNLAQGISERLLTEEAEISYLMANTQRMPFSQIRRFIPQGIQLVVTGQATYVTSPIKNFKESKELQKYDLLAQLIQAGVREGKFTPLKAAAIAKRLGSPEATEVLLHRNMPIERAATFVLSRLQKQKEELLKNPGVISQIAAILTKSEKPELRAYLGTKKLALALFDKGLQLEEAGRIKEAIQAYLEAINLDPLGKYYSFLGIAFRKLGRLEEAARAYQKAVAVAPGDFLYQLQLADVLEATGRAKARESIAAYHGVIAGYERITRTKRPSHISEPEWRHFTETLKGRIRTILSL